MWGIIILFALVLGVLALIKGSMSSARNTSHRRYTSNSDSYDSGSIWDFGDTGGSDSGSSYDSGGGCDSGGFDGGGGCD